MMVITDLTHFSKAMSSSVCATFVQLSVHFHYYTMLNWKLTVMFILNARPIVSWVKFVKYYSIISHAN